jgi:hypothetical protein
VNSAALKGNAYCGHCGGDATGAAGTHGERPTSEAHLPCQQQLVMEPPRYCTVCRRRMKVQVTPLGWTAECSRHGVVR